MGNRQRKKESKSAFGCCRREGKRGVERAGGAQLLEEAPLLSTLPASGQGSGGKMGLRTGGSPNEEEELC